ncbi:MAG TPA: hypothetical protein VJY33_14845, partial [Isosphaeraceae bacterium]|nr:hypothetical protein [Isosphaeraceae bacterium]
EPTPLNQLIPHIAADFVEVVQRMMRKLPEERYATPLQVAQALEPFIEEYPRIRDGEPVLVPLIIGEPVERPVASTPTSAEVQATVLLPAVELQPQLAAGSTGPAASSLAAPGPGREPVSPLPSPELGRDQPAAAAPSFSTPVSDKEVNSSTKDIPLILDLGPERSLTDSLSHSKSWFGSDKPVRTQGAAASTSPKPIPVADHLRGLLSWQDHPWLWWLDAAAVVLALLVVGYVLARWLAKEQKTAQHRNLGTAGKQAATPQPGQPPQPVNGTGGADRETVDPKGKPKPTITVLTDDGEEKPVEDLFQAMEMAIGAKGWVVLHNREPLSLPPREQPINLVGTGRLKLRAAQGVKPVLIVELKGQKPFLTVGPGMNLTLEGLTVKARYLDPPPGGPASPTLGLAPIILAGGPAQIRYCAFEVVNGTKVNATRALIVDGSNLTIENCWFKGFQTALEVYAIGGSTTLVKQTMIVPATRRIADSSAGWGLKMQFMGGNSRGSARRLILRHCTVAGSGLLQLAGFSPQYPVQVEATGCAVQTDVLVGWETITPETPSNPQTLQWKGKGNQLNVRGAAWIVPLGKGVLGPAAAAVDRNGWLRIATEEEPVIGNIQFSSKPEAHPELLTPSDYAIEKTEPGKVGASPEQVGPGAARPPHSAS